MEYYKASTLSWRAPIEKIEVERESKDSIWINGRRNAKRAGYENHFKTFEEAKNWLIQVAEDEKNKFERDLDQAIERLNKLESLTGHN